MSGSEGPIAIAQHHLELDGGSNPLTLCCGYHKVRLAIPVEVGYGDGVVDQSGDESKRPRGEGPISVAQESSYPATLPQVVEVLVRS